MSPALVIAAAESIPPLFALLALMLAGVVMVSLLLLRLRQSMLAGYFICGVLIANSGVLALLGGGESHEQVSQMAEFGVVLLMFTLGLEFSLGELRFLRRLAFAGGGWQMGLCMAVVAAASTALHSSSWQGAVLLSVALAMSSTAVSLKSFQDLGLEASPGARMALAVAIFQDLFIIVFFLFLPLLLPHEGAATALMPRLGSLALRGGAFVVLAGVAARWVIPWLLNAVTRTRSRELFTLSVIGSCVGLAFVGGLLGLGLALGAFVAGLAVSESIFKHRILADVMPLKDLFLTLFFVSVGLMIDVKAAMVLWLPICTLTAVLMLSKAGLITLIARRLGLAHKQSLMAGIGLCSAGEFSLVLLQNAGGAHLWSNDTQQTLLAASALSMGLLPALLKFGIPLGDWLVKLGWGRGKPVKVDGGNLRQRISGLTDHAIICGHGPVGEKLNKALLDSGVRTLVVELNADTVHKLQRQGQAVLFADASHEETWELTQLKNARMVALTFPDATVNAQALAMIREHRPDISVLARARFSSDVERLKRLGATQVVNDETEASRAMEDAAITLQGA
ncbi:MAG: cation:proton antiporter [Prosthecobacter sp.]|uniref:cation:proton antiporter domain-containing protein n=1 Tax=Prosthecobacter sp. TaxID=1965333 RepID=UPI0025FD9B08|nr:cation:proton antiporter [Prosthecobacter sp.]MCF7787405.1 cation:proton antiporter [Prosthecobacter sp.]